jgi:hypothetical protein
MMYRKWGVAGIIKQAEVKNEIHIGLVETCPDL